MLHHPPFLEQVAWWGDIMRALAVIQRMVRIDEGHQLLLGGLQVVVVRR
jgi:hypothetical protein